MKAFIRLFNRCQRVRSVFEAEWDEDCAVRFFTGDFFFVAIILKLIGVSAQASNAVFERRVCAEEFCQ